MQIIPAIDLLAGKVVRLTKGNPHEATVYSDDPLKVALDWQALGARTLHVVDLSSALGQGNNLDMVKEIVRTLTIDVQVGGGIRDIQKAKELIAIGAKRIIIGTRSIEGEFLSQVIQEVGSQNVAVGVDVKEGLVAVKGWQEKTSLKGFDFISTLQEQGLKWIIYTDVSKDGTLSGLDMKEVCRLERFNKMNIIISGGISSVNDLRTIKREASFIWGAILGKSLYEGKINLKEALSMAE